MASIDTKVAIAIIVAITVISIAIVGLIIGISVVTTPQDDRTVILITAAVGVIGPTVVALLALLKTANIHTDLHNGVLKDSVKQAVVKVEKEIRNG